jgi:hypothetical protein
LTDIFASTNATHRGIRGLVKLGNGKPESVDTLVLARLQIEGLSANAPSSNTWKPSTTASSWIA